MIMIMWENIIVWTLIVFEAHRTTHQTIVIKPGSGVDPAKEPGPGFYGLTGSTHKTHVIYGVRWLKKEMEKESNYKEVKWDPMWQGIGMGEGDVLGCWLFCAEIS
jgi:hypothetical protein